MNTPTKFVKNLEKNQVNQLNELMKNSNKPRIRQRYQAIILSS
jgi:hypothetical protein